MNLINARIRKYTTSPLLRRRVTQVLPASPPCGQHDQEGNDDHDHDHEGRGNSRFLHGLSIPLHVPER